MTPEDQHKLIHFLRTFDAVGLGEGDINAGVNTLASMLCTLSNIARPGSGILSDDKKVSHVGCNILVSGPLSSSLVTDDVLEPLRIRQNNLTAQLERVRAMKRNQEQLGPPLLRNFLNRPQPNDSENALLGILGDESGSTASRSNQWSSVTRHPPNPDFGELTGNTKVVITATGPAQLEKQLSGTHLGHPLAVMGLPRTSGTGRTASLCDALMDGRYPDGAGGKTVRGNLILTDPGDMLNELAKNGGEHVAWLDRMLWLVDGHAGPVAPDCDPPASPLGNVHSMFVGALASGFGKRLDHKSPHPTLHKINFTPAQHRWMKFLRSMEESLPGISGSVRNLLATLAFGVLELTATPVVQTDAQKHLKGIEQFASLLIQRMANARNVMTYSFKETRNAELRESILLKLEEGPHTVRDLTRRFNRLTAPDCRRLLSGLLEDGKVGNSGGEWHLSDTPANTSPLTLDIT
ncbi:hypothetical protein NT6N_03910 [Oceaniferula spumae]|uniref:DUF3987 domain-containing protein n=1 Tax=Oceaniferula spumae TaxID=2979115 RepID=A0AAT9FH82_9BACT